MGRKGSWAERIREVREVFRMDNAPHQPWVLWVFAVGSVPYGLACLMLGPSIGADRSGGGVLVAVGAAGSYLGIRRFDSRIAHRKRLKHAKPPGP